MDMNLNAEQVELEESVGGSELTTPFFLGGADRGLIPQDSRHGGESSTNPEYHFQQIHGVRVRQRAHERAHFSDGGGASASPLRRSRQSRGWPPANTNTN